MRIGSAAASVAVHGAVFAMLLWLPERARPLPADVAPAPTKTEVTLLSEAQLQRALGEPAESRTQPAAHDSPVEPAPPGEPAAELPAPPQRQPSASEHDAPPVASNPDPASPAPPSPDAAGAPLLPDASGPQPQAPPTNTRGAGGLALLDRPGHDDAGSLAPRLAPGALGPMRPAARTPPSRNDDSFAVLPLPGPKDIKTPADAGFVRKRDGRLVFRDPDPSAQWSAQLLPDGRLRFEDHALPKGTQGGAGAKIPGLARGNVPGSGGGAAPSLAHTILMAQGFKFWLKRKQRLIKATRALRLAMAVDFAQRNIDRQLAQLVGDLAKIWASNKPPRTRRGLLFEVWDECEESLVVQLGEFSDGEASRIDSIRAEAATKARTRVIAFIRRTLPQDSTDAFPVAELAALNRRRASRERFAPYAAS